MMKNKSGIILIGVAISGLAGLGLAFSINLLTNKLDLPLWVSIVLMIVFILLAILGWYLKREPNQATQPEPIRLQSGDILKTKSGPVQKATTINNYYGQNVPAAIPPTSEIETNAVLLPPATPESHKQDPKNSISQSGGNQMTNAATPIQPLKMFISYSHADKKYRDEMDKHLIALKDEGLIVVWYDGFLQAGDVWEKEIRENIEAAQIFLFLVSSDFLNSAFIKEYELKRAVEKDTANTARIIPVLIRPVYFEGTVLSKYQFYPQDENNNLKAVSKWADRDEAYQIIAKAIKKQVLELRAKFSNDML
jgi:hypothetical protein